MTFVSFEGYYKTICLTGNKKTRRFPVSRLSLSEVMTIILLFHTGGYRCFKE
jgi:hypothetical protein